MRPRGQLGWAILALTLAAAPLRGDIRLPGFAPPQADNASLKVRRGEMITIPLQAHYGGNDSLTFQIVKRPEHGKLSDLRLVSDNHATVNYRHDEPDAATEDSFRFLVKTGAGRVSSPAEVHITIIDSSPRLQVAPRIQFGTILAGGKENRPLRIINAGGGVLEGRVAVSAPWQVSTDDYRITAGRSETIEITFQPGEGRHYIGRLTLTNLSGEEREVSLEGTSTAPLEIEPRQLPARAQEHRPGSSPALAVTMTRGNVPPIPTPVTVATPATPLTTTAPTPAPTTSADRFVAVRAHRVDGSVWELSWATPREAVARYEIAERSLALDHSGRLQTSWQSLGQIKISLSGPSVVATISKLTPDPLHVVRVTALAADGRALWESAPVSLSPPEKSSRSGRASLLLLGLALVVLIGWRWQSKRSRA